jgi:hypothetical protein
MLQWTLIFIVVAIMLSYSALAASRVKPRGSPTSFSLSFWSCLLCPSSFEADLRRCSRSPGLKRGD